MSFIDDRNALTREKRLSAISHFHGSLENLIDEVSGQQINQRIRTFAQIHEDEIIYAFKVLGKIRDAAIVVNGSIGCSAIGIGEAEYKNLQWYTTNLVERDTILGGDEKLREAVIRAYREQRPKAIFILGTPVVAINNDDINSVIFELEDELEIPIISIYTDGFKSKTPLTGYDIVTHSLLKYVVDRESVEDKEDFINVISYSESVEDLDSVVKLLQGLNIKHQIIPQFASIEQIRNASKAKASIVLNPEEGAYLAEELQEVFGVSYVETTVPIGLDGTQIFITKLAKFLKLENEANQYIKEQEKLFNSHSEIKALKGKKVFLDASLSKISYFADVVKTLGGEVVGISIPEIDLQNRKELKKLERLSKGTTVVIGNGQYFEKANALHKTQSQILISDRLGSSSAIDEGVTVVTLADTAVIGYEGYSNFLKRIDKAERIRKVLNIDPTASKYKKSWLSKNGNWYVKQEVR